MKNSIIAFIAIIMWVNAAAQIKNSVTLQGIGDPPKMAETSAIKVEPEYPGGVKAFYNFIASQFKTPKVGYAVTVKVYAKFIVEKDGTMSNFVILKDPGYGLGDETIRVLKLCYKKWKPGTIDGLPVRAAYNLPLTINIKN